MEEQFIRLTEEILSKNKRNLISWSPSNYSSVYQAPLGKGVIMISFDEDGPHSNPEGNLYPIYSISFINERGEKFFSFGAIDEDDLYYELLKEIYQTAHSSYMKIDETLKSMFDDLRSR